MIRPHLKGGRVKTNGLYFAAAQAIQEYIEKAGLERAVRGFGPLPPYTYWSRYDERQP